MATHSSILAWEIPWTEKPGGYSSWGHKELDATERLNNNLQRQLHVRKPLFSPLPSFLTEKVLLLLFQTLPFPAHD